MEYRFSKEAQRIADDVISKHHPHLLGVKVLVVFMDKTPKSGGKDVWGRAKKISGLPAFLAGEGDRNQYSDQPADFFVVELSEEIWQGLRPKQKRALIDHELSHMEIGFDEETGAVKLKIVGHDVTEFSAILERHGLWTEPLEDFVRAGAEQLDFSEVATGPEEPTLEGAHRGLQVVK